MTVRAQESEVGEAIVQGVAVDMVDVKHQRLPLPLGQEGALGALVRDAALDHESPQCRCG
jgi:hypothetical protein